MSDLKWKTEEELLEEVKSNQKYINKLEDRLERQEREIGDTKHKLNNMRMRQQWAIKYLTGECLTRNPDAS